jgi:hypothetical protein
MPRKAIVTVAALLAIAGCSSARKQFDPNVFAPVRTIEVKDATDPVLLASTSAKRVSEYLEIGLKARGYAVCRECQSDAVATLTVRTYSTQQNATRDWFWFNRQFVEYGLSIWTLSIVRNGETIFQKRMDRRKAMQIDQLAAEQVQDALRQIPARQ